MTTEAVRVAFDFIIDNAYPCQVTLNSDQRTWTADFMRDTDASICADWLIEHGHKVTHNPEGYYARVV